MPRPAEISLGPPRQLRMLEDAIGKSTPFPALLDAAGFSDSYLNSAASGLSGDIAALYDFGTLSVDAAHLAANAVSD